MNKKYWYWIVAILALGIVAWYFMPKANAQILECAVGEMVQSVEVSPAIPAQAGTPAIPAYDDYVFVGYDSHGHGVGDSDFIFDENGLYSRVHTGGHYEYFYVGNGSYSPIVHSHGAYNKSTHHDGVPEVPATPEVQ